MHMHIMLIMLIMLTQQTLSWVVILILKQPCASVPCLCLRNCNGRTRNHTRIRICSYGLPLQSIRQSSSCKYQLDHTAVSTKDMGSSSRYQNQNQTQSLGLGRSIWWADDIFTGYMGVTTSTRASYLELWVQITSTSRFFVSMCQLTPAVTFCLVSWALRFSFWFHRETCLYMDVTIPWTAA